MKKGKSQAQRMKERAQSAEHEVAAKDQEIAKLREQLAARNPGPSSTTTPPGRGTHLSATPPLVLNGKIAPLKRPSPKRRKVRNLTAMKVTATQARGTATSGVMGTVATRTLASALTRRRSRRTTTCTSCANCCRTFGTNGSPLSTAKL